jgi:hypothetical protein
MDEVLFHDRPGGAIYEPAEIKRGVKGRLREGSQIRLTDSKGGSHEVTRLDLTERSDGAAISFIQGRFVAGELTFPSFEAAVEFLRGALYMAESAPPATERTDT